MTKEELEGFLYNMCSDTCNRFLGAVDNLGAVNRAKRNELAEKITRAKYDLLDEWIPIIAKTIIDANDAKKSLKPIALNF